MAELRRNGQSFHLKSGMYGRRDILTTSLSEIWRRVWPKNIIIEIPKRRPFIEHSFEPINSHFSGYLDEHILGRIQGFQI